jgi:hypothetical protein
MALQSKPYKKFKINIMFELNLYNELIDKRGNVIATIHDLGAFKKMMELLLSEDNRDDNEVELEDVFKGIAGDNLIL